MKTLFTISLLFLSFFAKADSWTRKADFGGRERRGAFSFSIGNKGYVGGGGDITSNILQDFWEYDPSLDSWAQKADYAGGPILWGIGFSTLNKGYAGLGAVNNLFYEYNPSTNIWTAKANYPLTNWNSFYPVSYSVGNLGYVCSGQDSSGLNNDLWQYDPSLDTWTRRNNLSGIARGNAIGFSIANKGYVGSGVDDNLNFLNDFWEYDPSIDSWAQKANTPGAVRADAAGFSICRKGYMAVGEGPTIGSFLNDLWQYDPVVNQWIQKTNFPGGTRDEMAYFTIGNKAYVGLGGHDDPSYNDFYEYTPDSCSGIGEGLPDLQVSPFQFQLSPNPAKDVIVSIFNSNVGKKIEINIFDVTGNIVEARSVISLQTNIDVSGFASGVYFIEAIDEKERSVQKFLKE